MQSVELTGLKKRTDRVHKIIFYVDHFQHQDFQNTRMLPSIYKLLLLLLMLVKLIHAHLPLST